MRELLFGGLLSTPGPSAQIVVIICIALFTIVGIMVGADCDGINAPALTNLKDKNKD